MSVEKAKQDLYGVDGIGATNVKFVLGSNRDVTADQIAAQVSAVIKELREGVNKASLCGCGIVHSSSDRCGPY